MLNRNNDSDRGRKKRNLLDSVVLSSARSRRHDLRDRLDPRSLQEDRRSRFHLVRGIYVMRGVGFRQVLAVFRERRQSRHRERQ